jgi:hypothetical protein
MKIEFLTDFEARTTTGVQLIAAGRVVDLDEDKANRLIAAGVAKAIDAVPLYNPNALPYIDNRGRLVIPFDCPPKYRYWAGGQSVRDTLKEIFEERAAIMQFDGRLTRDQAVEETARIMTRYVQEYSDNGDKP